MRKHDGTRVETVRGGVGDVELSGRFWWCSCFEVSLPAVGDYSLLAVEYDGDVACLAVTTIESVRVFNACVLVRERLIVVEEVVVSFGYCFWKVEYEDANVLIINLACFVSDGDDDVVESEVCTVEED